MSENAEGDTPSPPPKAPGVRWTSSCFDRCLTYIEQANTLLHVSMAGVALLPRVPDAVETLLRYEKPGPARDHQEAALERSRKMAALAESELARDFPLLRAHTVVAFWGAIETLCKDLLVEWLINEPETRQNDHFSAVKISLADYDRMDHIDRMHYLVREVERTTKADLKLGINRFETLLDAVGLAGPVDEALRRTLFEVSQVRNVTVHRSSIADKKFVDACPWLGLKVGDPVLVSSEKSEEYFEALTDYVLLLVNRVRVRFGAAPRSLPRTAPPEGR